MSVNCYACGVPILLAADVEATLRNSGATFYCHAGHAQSFRVGPTKAEREVKRLVGLLEAWIEYHGERCAERDAARKRARTCPLCDEVLRGRGRLGWHLEQVHGARSAEDVARDLEALEGAA